MPRSDNQKAVTTYLSLELYDQLANFKNDEGLRSDSGAIAMILERFFCESIPHSRYQSDLEQRLEALEKKFTVLSTVPSTVESAPAHKLEQLEEQLISLRKNTRLGIQNTRKQIQVLHEELISLRKLNRAIGVQSSTVPITAESTVLDDHVDISLRDISSDRGEASEDDNRFILGLLGAGNEVLGYWKSVDAGFVPDLSQARIYQGETNAKRAVTQISKRFGLSKSQSICYKPLSKFQQSCTDLVQYSTLR
jgi:hypothetical protein